MQEVAQLSQFDDELYKVTGKEVKTLTTNPLTRKNCQSNMRVCHHVLDKKLAPMVGTPGEFSVFTNLKKLNSLSLLHHMTMPRGKLWTNSLETQKSFVKFSKFPTGSFAFVQEP